MYHGDIDYELNHSEEERGSATLVTTPMLQENNDVGSEEFEQTELSVLPTVGIVIESGEQVP